MLRLDVPKHVGLTRKLALVLIACAITTASCAELKEAGRQIGHGTRDAAKAVGHGVRDAAREVGKSVNRAAESDY